MNWEVEFEKFMEELRKLPFSKRKRFFEYLENLCNDRVSFEIAWPDTLLFIEAGDWSKCLSDVKGTPTQ